MGLVLYNNKRDIFSCGAYIDAALRTGYFSRQHQSIMEEKIVTA